MSSKPISPKAAPRAFQFATDLCVLMKDAAVRWAGDACYRLGAALAYYALFSLFPLLLLSVTAIGYLLGDDNTVREQVLASLSGVGSPESRALLDQTLQSMQTHRTARGIGAVVGGVTLLLGASGVFTELESSLNFLWRAKPSAYSGMWGTVFEVIRAKAFAFAVVIGSAVALLASLVMSTVLGAFAVAASGATAVDLLRPLIDMGVSVGFLTLVLAAIYRIVPKPEIEWRDVLGAAFLTSLLFALLKLLLAWYLAHLGSYAAYGAVGAVLGLLTWIYVAILVLFYGAELSVLYAERFGSRASSRDGTTPALPTFPQCRKPVERTCGAP